MNNRKLLLAHIRNGNYSHPGEEEVIDMVLKFINKNPTQKMLDVGSGLGGTANYIASKGYGEVVGIDIDDDVLEKSKNFYPNIKFYHGDANNLTKFFINEKFTIIYSFSAFFCFTDQENCLKELAMIGNEDASLFIIDYTSPRKFTHSNPFVDQTGKSTAKASFNPINLMIIEENLNKANWKLIKIINLNEQYKSWYQNLVSKMKKEKQELIQRFGEIAFSDLLISFNRIIELLERNELGGAIIYSKKLFD